VDPEKKAGMDGYPLQENEESPDPYGEKSSGIKAFKIGGLVARANAAASAAAPRFFSILFGNRIANSRTPSG